jgi:hypothetical protein
MVTMPASRQPRKDHQNQHHRGDGDTQVHDQFVNRSIGLGAVVAGHGHFNAGGDRLQLQFFQLGQHGIRHDDGIGAGFLGDGQRHGGIFTGQLFLCGRPVGEAGGFLDSAAPSSTRAMSFR